MGQSSASANLLSMLLLRRFILAWFRFCICFGMLSVMVCRASVVLESDLKAYCVFDIVLCLYGWVISWSFIIVSSAFAIIRSSDIGV